MCRKEKKTHTLFHSTSLDSLYSLVQKTTPPVLVSSISPTSPQTDTFRHHSPPHHRHQMLPSSDSPPPPHYTKLKAPSLSDRIKPHHHRAIYFFLAVLLLQLLLLFSTPSLPFSLTHSSLNTTTTTGAPISPKCPYGRIYIYTLPPQLNSEILHNCNKINPWLSRCDALSNSGFGQLAGDELARVIPHELTPAWHWTDQFSLEVIFHNRMLTYPCRTSNPSSASAFYIPFYTGLAIEPFLFNKTSTDSQRDFHCDSMLNWVSQQQFYRKSNGADHFISIGRITWDFRRSRPNEWGSGCVYDPRMRNITRLLIERNPWDDHELGVPYPTGFHPRSVSDVRHWQGFVGGRVRKTRFSFAGARRGYIKGDFRGVLLGQCESEPRFCRVVDCGGKKCVNGSTAILEAFLDSEFCLQPRGDSLTRRSVFDCMVAGSIPVFFWHRTAYLQYEGFLPGEPGSYSVFIDRNEVKNGTSINKVLEGISGDKVREMRRNVIENIPKIVYAKTSQGLEGGMKDAFDVGVEKVLRRIKETKKEGV